MQIPKNKVPQIIAAAIMVEPDHEVQPEIGSVVKVALSLPLADHSGIYIGDDKIVELANINGTATIRIVSSEHFKEGDDKISRIGSSIYVACKKNRNGKCIAMGSQDIADRAKAAVGETSQYSLFFNNCHMFTEYCITGKKYNLLGTLSGVQAALNKKFIQHDDECLLNTWLPIGAASILTDENESEPDNESDEEPSSDEEENSEFDELLAKAEGGDVEAQFQVAECYIAGDGVDEDEEEAFYWYGEAADNGHTEAMYEVADCYYFGTGVDEDEEEAVSWYRKAARKGHVEAMLKLAQRYYDGAGVRENIARAKDWFKRAAEAGSKEAKKKLKDYFNIKT